MNKTWIHLKNGDLVRRAEEFLIQYILSGEVRPGEYLPPEQTLCAKLGIGRSTLREAVSILQSKGLVERRHGIGVRVIDRSQEAASNMLQLMLKRASASARDLLEMRRLYEVQAAAWAAQRATAEEISAIAAALDRMRAAQSAEEYAEADLAFHVAIARATHNTALALFVETIRTLLADAILANLRTSFRPGPTLQFHERVFQAITARNAGQASQAMTEHLDDTERMIRQAREAQASEQ
ncbi:MAG: FadR/GntR family transcriptional regulator [Planctomycetota bacterium]